MSLTTRDITQIAMFTSLLAIASIISIPIGDVPITMQTLVVMLIGLTLSPKNSVLSVIAYLIIGSIGVPVFASGKGGFDVILGPTGGFLISFVFAVYFISKMKSVKIINNEIIHISTILLLANLFIYMSGWTYFALYMNFDLLRTLGILWPFAIADLLKISVATYAYSNIRSYITYERAQI